MSNNESKFQIPEFPEHFSKQQKEDFELAMDLIYCANDLFDDRAEAARSIARSARRDDKDNLYLPSAKNWDVVSFNNYSAEFEQIVKVAGALMPLEVTFVATDELI